MSTPFFNKQIDDPINPFSGDYTEKLEKVSVGLTNLLKIESKMKPLVVTIDAPWGIGKTTFIDMWGQTLLNTNILAIKFDAWKSDYTDFPLMALVTQLIGQLKNQNVEEVNIAEIVEKGKKLCNALVPGLVRFGVNWMLRIFKADEAAEKLSNEIEDSLKSNIDKQISDEFNRYESNVIALNEFKMILKSIAKERVIFLFIDELDRCKPSFAIKTLETIKHIFDVEGVCCIISTNLDSLAQVIKKSYGYSISEAKDYLERFYDIPIKLPDPDKKKYLEYQIKSIHPINLVKPSSYRFIETMQICCESANFSLRIIEKYVRDIRIFIEHNESSGVNKLPNIYLPCVALEIAYRRIASNDIRNDLKVALNNNSYFKKLYIFYNASKDLDQFNKALNDFYSDFNSLRKKSSLTNDDHDVIKNYETIHNELIMNIYGGAKSLRFSPISANANPPLYVIDRYLNHFEMAKNIIEFINLIPA